MNYERGLLAFLMVLLIICCLISTKTQARNNYLFQEMNKKAENAE